MSTTAVPPPPPPPVVNDDDSQQPQDVAAPVDSVIVEEETATRAVTVVNKDRSSSVDSYMEMSRAENDKKAEIREQAQKDIKDFYANRAVKIEENKQVQIEDEKEFINKAHKLDDPTATTNPWTVVANHINFYKDNTTATTTAAVAGGANDKTTVSTSTGHKDMTTQKDGGNQMRMKQLLQDLRKNGMMKKVTTAGGA
ncbi:hypothetical protein FOL47_000646 [Perkinsus chesapeaki]|uniref:Clathrin light chain n=1 Tax=Perkinsus chesapeaki TaxID=330153 RepID=A0A7J6ML62_PERCH|nr:hypothetical protein FOL47_000646 [Perkinsus chesapeaki]